MLSLVGRARGRTFVRSLTHALMHHAHTHARGHERTRDTHICVRTHTVRGSKCICECTRAGVAALLQAPAPPLLACKVMPSVCPCTRIMSFTKIFDCLRLMNCRHSDRGCRSTGIHRHYSRNPDGKFCLSLCCFSLR